MNQTRWAGVLALLVALALSGCSTTVTRVVLVTPTPLATTPSTQASLAMCTHVKPDPALPAGDLFIGATADFGPQASPEVKLADNLPLKPYSLGYSGTGPLPAGLVANANPSPQDGFVVTVCNGTTKAHNVTQLVVRIQSFTPYNGQLNEWNACNRPYSGDPYSNPGCSITSTEDGYAHASFAADADVGTTAVAQQGRLSGPAIPTFFPTPLTGYTQSFAFDVHVSTAAPGYYTFEFGLAIDGAAPIYDAVSPTTLLAPVTHEWDGASCTSSAMHSQIPPQGNPPSYYLCPRPAGG